MVDPEHAAWAYRKFCIDHVMGMPEWSAQAWAEAKLGCIKRESKRYCGASRIAAAIRGWLALRKFTFFREQVSPSPTLNPTPTPTPGPTPDPYPYPYPNPPSPASRLSRCRRRPGGDRGAGARASYATCWSKIGSSACATGPRLCAMRSSGGSSRAAECSAS